MPGPASTMKCMTKPRWIAYTVVLIIGAFLIVAASNAGAGPWLVLGLMVALAVLASLLDLEYWGWRGPSRR